MKQISILIIILFSNSIILNAQTVSIATRLSNPRGMTLVGDEIYYCELFKISKIDLTTTVPTPTNVATSLLLPESIAINGNYLYIAQYNGNKISKIDITTTTTNTTDVLTNLYGPTGILFNGNDLYFAQALSGKISKIDITETSPTVTDVVTGLSGPTGIVLIGNNLYISEVYDGKISKIDIIETTPTAIDVVTGLTAPRGIAFNGNDIYIAEFGADKISKINITETIPIPTDVVTDLDGPLGLEVNGDNLYISDLSKILKLDLTTLSTNNLQLINSINLYPNPANDFIKISGLNQKEKYNIYNLLGQNISSGIISDKEDISIQNLSKGLYLLKFKNGHIIKFIKK
jgi:hypothetical protein